MDKEKEVLEQEAPEKEAPTLEEMIETRTQQLTQVDSSILTTQRLIQGSSIKVVDANEMPEGQEPLTLSISGGELIRSMLSPTLDKLLKDRGSISYDLDRFRAIKANQEQK